MPSKASLEKAWRYNYFSFLLARRPAKHLRFCEIKIVEELSVKVQEKKKVQTETESNETPESTVVRTSQQTVDNIGTIY